MANQHNIQDQLLHYSTLAHAAQRIMQQYTLPHAQATRFHPFSLIDDCFWFLEQ